MSDYDKTVVKFSAKFVRNMGNYESLHIEYGIEDGPRGDENVSQAFNRIEDFIESRLLDKIASVEEAIDKTRGR